jgi:hypothetical protein
MIVASLSQYLPVGDLLKIVAATLVVAVIAPTAVSVGILGLDRREQAAEHQTSSATGLALIGVAVLVIGALIAAGIYALFEH